MSRNEVRWQDAKVQTFTGTGCNASMFTDWPVGCHPLPLMTDEIVVVVGGGALQH